MITANGISNDDPTEIERDFDSTVSAITRRSQVFTEGDPLTLEDSWQITFDEAQRLTFGQVGGDAIWLNGINNLYAQAVSR